MCGVCEEVVVPLLDRFSLFAFFPPTHPVCFFLGVVLFFFLLLLAVVVWFGRANDGKAGPGLVEFTAFA